MSCQQYWYFSQPEIKDHATSEVKIDTSNGRDGFRSGFEICRFAAPVRNIRRAERTQSKLADAAPLMPLLPYLDDAEDGSWCTDPGPRPEVTRRDGVLCWCCCGVEMLLGLLPSRSASWSWVTILPTWWSMFAFVVVVHILFFMSPRMPHAPRLTRTPILDAHGLS